VAVEECPDAFGSQVYPHLRLHEQIQWRGDEQDHDGHWDANAEQAIEQQGADSAGVQQQGREEPGDEEEERQAEDVDQPVGGSRDSLIRPSPWRRRR
jgi:hypothetical protein